MRPAIWRGSRTRSGPACPRRDRQVRPIPKMVGRTEHPRRALVRAARRLPRRGDPGRQPRRARVVGDRVRARYRDRGAPGSAERAPRSPGSVRGEVVTEPAEGRLGTTAAPDPLVAPVRDQAPGRDGRRVVRTVRRQAQGPAGRPRPRLHVRAPRLWTGRSDRRLRGRRSGLHHDGRLLRCPLRLTPAEALALYAAARL